MKLLKIGLTSILVFIIIVLSVYIVITDKPSLLKVPINFYLKKYNISSSIGHINIKSPRALELSGFHINKKGLSLYADFLLVSIDKSGKISLVLKNPDITIKQNNNNYTKKTGFKLPFAIGKINIKNLNLKMIKNSREVANLKNMDILLNQNRIHASGHIKYSYGGAFVIADIKNLTGLFHLSEKGVGFDSIVIDPNFFSLKFKNVSFNTKHPVKINNLYINFNPLKVETINFNNTLGVFYKNRSFNVDLNTQIKQKKYLSFLLNMKKIREQTGFLTMDNLKIEGVYKKKLKAKLNYKNLSIESKNVTAQNLSGVGYIDSINNITGNILSGEMIAFDRWYLNFSKNTLGFNLRNKPAYRAEFSLNGLFRSEVEYIDKKHIKFSILSNSLKQFFKTFIQDAYADSAQSLKYVKLSGNFNANGIYNPKSRGFFGILNLNAKNISIKNKTVHNLTMKLPVAYNYEKKLNGFFKIDNISVDKYPFSADAKLYAENGNLKIVYKILNTKNFHIKPSDIIIDLKNKKLKTAADFDFHDKLVRINAKFKRILIDKDRADLFGTIKANAFGGTIITKDIHIENLFRLPVLKTDISFNHINLRDITKNTNFGLVTGFIKGYIKNLSLVKFTEPLSFNMLIKTQKVKGASKKITLKAINSISKIGGGYASVAIPFFKTFPYSKIGFYAKLKNGIFYLNGLYKDKNNEYIIKRAFLIGINVINMNKNNHISWDDMLDRIKRVKKGG